ncbi:MAG TPA: hypothetical protein PK358_09700 [Spirochaetota bacterium]|nr:hypothetical protein [Spirochaetota bacterium]HPJ35096.1 hypothetical protein [Spirochaetota bacterium]
MKFYKTKCSKCGYELVVPEDSLSVICGSCGKINHFSKLTTILRKQAETGIDLKFPGEQPDYHEDSFSGTSESQNRQFPASPGENRAPLPDEDEEYPEQKSALKIMTVLFILMPFIAMVMEYFDLPPYAAVLIIGAIIFIVFALKKRS